MFWLPLAGAALGGLMGAGKHSAAENQEKQDRAQLAAEQRYGWILGQTPHTQIRKAGSAFGDIAGGALGGGLTGASVGSALGASGILGAGAGAAGAAAPALSLTEGGAGLGGVAGSDLAPGYKSVWQGMLAARQKALPTFSSPLMGDQAQQPGAFSGGNYF
jgi:hypothetical protein